MLLNAYDTTVGIPNKAIDRVESTVAQLHIARSLTPTKKENVFVITNESSLPVPTFMFPITFQAYNGRMITVYDERPYRDKSNRISSPNEIMIMKLAAFLQQDVVEGNVTTLKNGRLQATKAFAEALSSRMSQRAGLNPNEVMTLKVLLAYYFIGLEEENNTDLELVTINVVRSIYGSEKGFVLGVIEGLPKLNRLGASKPGQEDGLLEAIHQNPILFKLKSLTLKDFIQLIGGIMFSSIGPKVIAAACEAPCLFTALVYGAVRFRQYQKTALGIALDPKYNKNTLESFTKNIDFAYDLNG